MRALRKLDHDRFPDRDSAATLRQREREAVKQQEKSVWLGRFVRLAALAGFVAMAFVVAGVISRARSSIEGLVVASMRDLVAPADVVVTELAVTVGQQVAAGDLLLTIAPLNDAELRAAERAVHQAELRLALVQAGAGIDVVDTTSRLTGIEEAQRLAARAREGEAAASARLDSVLAERDAMELRAKHDRARLGEELQALRARKRATAAELDAAGAELDLAESKLEAAETLEVEGSTARQRVATLRTERETAAEEVRRLTAAAEAIDHQINADQGTLDGLDERLAADLKAVDTRLEAARREVAQLRVDREAFYTSAEHRRRLAAGAGDPALLRSLEIELLQTELEERRAKFEHLSRALGGVTFYAEFAGVVDVVEVTVGSVFNQGKLLVRYFDPETRRIEVYATARQVDLFAVGDRCRVLPPGDAEAIPARVVDKGQAWIPVPPLLNAVEEPEEFLRLPMRLHCPELPSVLRPNARVLVVF